MHVITTHISRLSLESAAWRAWQTFSAEMARIADEREARQGVLERKVNCFPLEHFVLTLG